MKKRNIKLGKIQVEMLPDGRMDTTNAAIYLGCSAGELTDMRSFENGPDYVKVVSRIFYFRKSLDIWIKSKMVCGQPKKLPSRPLRHRR